MESRPRVLVIDDEPSMLGIAQRTLRRSAEVLAFRDPQAALDELLFRTPDLVVSDLCMPGLSGIDVWLRLNTVAPVLANTMVLMTGGATAPAEAALLQSFPEWRVLYKPFSPTQLQERVAYGLSLAAPDHRWRAP
jgi:DNA-binding NtrC family response regulator